VVRRLQVAIDCADPERLVTFWATVLGYVIDAPPAGYASWQDFSRSAGGVGESWSAVVDPARATNLPSPANGVRERFFGTLKYEHLYRAPIDDGGALAMETARFRDIYNRIRPHQALDDRTPRQAYLDT
jgi:hypothetical protein